MSSMLTSIGNVLFLGLYRNSKLQLQYLDDWPVVVEAEANLHLPFE